MVAITVACWVLGNILLSVISVGLRAGVFKRLLFMVIWFTLYWLACESMAGYFFTHEATTIPGKTWIAIKAFLVFWFASAAIGLIPTLIVLYKINKANERAAKDKIKELNNSIPQSMPNE